MLAGVVRYCIVFRLPGGTGVFCRLADCGATGWTLIVRYDHPDGRSELRVAELYPFCPIDIWRRTLTFLRRRHPDAELLVFHPDRSVWAVVGNGVPA